MLLRYADRNAMAFSRETRFPFLDHELVDWAISLPESLLVRAGWQKYVLRRAIDGIAPPSVQWRTDKVGYAAPLDRWLRGDLSDWARDRFLDPQLADVPGYDRPVLEDLWREHTAGKANHSWALWRWISLSEWLNLIHSGRLRNRFEAPRLQPDSATVG